MERIKYTRIYQRRDELEPTKQKALEKNDFFKYFTSVYR